MQKQRAFTMIELLVVIAIIAVLMGLLFPAIGAIKNQARQKENNVNVRGIIQSMITFSGSNREFFPGFNGVAFISDGLLTTGNSGDGFDAEARYWILLDGNYVDPEFMISPSETKETWPNEQYAGAQRERVYNDNYSYAMLQISNGGGTNDADAYRRSEWRNQQNPLAPVVTDRLAETSSITPNPGNTNTYLSIHDGSTEGNWIGSIGYGDLSVEFSKTSEVETRFGDYRNEEDDIFNTGDGGGDNAYNEPDKNAGVTYTDADEPLGLFE